MYLHFTPTQSKTQYWIGEKAETERLSLVGIVSPVPSLVERSTLLPTMLAQKLWAIKTFVKFSFILRNCEITAPWVVNIEFVPEINFVAKILATIFFVGAPFKRWYVRLWRMFLSEFGRLYCLWSSKLHFQLKVLVFS